MPWPNPEILAVIARLEDDLLALERQLNCLFGDAVPAPVKSSLKSLHQSLEQVELLLADSEPNKGE